MFALAKEMGAAPSLRHWLWCDWRVMLTCAFGHLVEPGCMLFVMLLSVYFGEVSQVNSGEPPKVAATQPWERLIGP